MMSYLKIIVTILFLQIIPTGSINPEDFLHDYGYLDSTKFSVPDLSSAIRNFQYMYNIRASGKLDRSTLEAMQKPRCGVRDRELRYGNFDFPLWEKTELTYNFTSFSTSRHKIDDFRVRSILKDAFRVWSRVTPLTFKHIWKGDADLPIGFHRGEHGDWNPFDGRGGRLAHAFYPLGGKIHFDDDENWVTGRSSFYNINLFYVAVHEIGHAIGLRHVNDTRAMMFPKHRYFGPPSQYRLHEIDRKNIQAMYGERKSKGRG